MAGDVVVKVVRSVDFDRIQVEARRRFFQRCMMAMHTYAATPGHVPIDTNTLRNSMAPGAGLTEADEDHAQVGTNVEPYPRVLEESDRYLYRGGPSGGMQTKGWLSKTLPAVRPEIEGLLSQMAREMEAGWRG